MELKVVRDSTSSLLLDSKSIALVRKTLDEMKNLEKTMGYPTPLDIDIDTRKFPTSSHIDLSMLYTPVLIECLIPQKIIPDVVDIIASYCGCVGDLLLVSDDVYNVSIAFKTNGTRLTSDLIKHNPTSFMSCGENEFLISIVASLGEQFFPPQISAEKEDATKKD